MASEAVAFPDDAVLTIEEVARYLRVGKNEAYDLVNRGIIPSVRIGRRRRIPYWGLREWVAQSSGAPYPLAEMKARKAGMVH